MGVPGLLGAALLGAGLAGIAFVLPGGSSDEVTRLARARGGFAVTAVGIRIPSGGPSGRFRLVVGNIGLCAGLLVQLALLRRPAAAAALLGRHVTVAAVAQRTATDARGQPPFRLISVVALRWVIRHRAWTPYYLIRYLRLLRLRLRQPSIIVQGMVFLGRRVELEVRPGYGRLILGGFVHIGDDTALRAHEGTLRVGEKTVFGRHTIVNSYLDVEIGPSALIADHVYIGDFDHRFDDMGRPIKDQGIAKAPVRIGAGCWLGVKATVLRGCTVGDGAVVGANSVVTRHVSPYSVVAGAPARVIADRRAAHAVAEQTRAALADIEIKTARAARDHAAGSAD